MRPIDADKFEEFIRKNCADSLVDLWCELVRRQPTIEAVPVVHGKWLTTGDLELDNIYFGNKCSVCGYVMCGNTGNFCPNCGAMMKGGENE